MTEPRIQYARTADGVSIAFATVGVDERGEFVPKGFDDPVRLFEVRWHD